MTALLNHSESVQKLKNATSTLQQDLVAAKNCRQIIGDAKEEVYEKWHCALSAKTFIYYPLKDNIISGEIMDLVLRIVGLYDTVPEAEFSIREISARLKATYSFVYKAVSGMVKDGVLHVAVKGRAKMCSLNLGSDRAIGFLAVYSTLMKDQFMERNHVLGELLSEFVKRVSGDDVYSIVLFGSYASGSATERSDVDLLVIGRPKAKLSANVNAEANSLQARYGRELNPIVLDKVMFLKSFRSKEVSVAKEAVSTHIVLFGFEGFWKLVKEGLG